MGPRRLCLTLHYPPWMDGWTVCLLNLYRIRMATFEPIGKQALCNGAYVRVAYNTAESTNMV